MQVTEENEYTYKVVLSDIELRDLKAESKNRDFTPLEIMKAVFFSVFVQIVSCFWRRAILGSLDPNLTKGSERIDNGKVEG